MQEMPGVAMEVPVAIGSDAAPLLSVRDLTVNFAAARGQVRAVAGVRRLLLVEKPKMRQLMVKWYEEVREQGCWLC